MDLEVKVPEDCATAAINEAQFLPLIKELRDRLQYKGLYEKQQVAEHEEEIKQALAEHNVNLSDNHKDGYDYLAKHRNKHPDRSAKKPWCYNVMATIPSYPQVYDLANWKHEAVKFTVSQGIAYITLCRPAANNAINDEITLGLNDACQILRERPDIRVAVLTGEGRMFCAGGDPKSFQSFQGDAKEVGKNVPSGQAILRESAAFDGNKASGNSFARLLYEFANLPQFTICCANGSAMGAGVGLICTSDMCIAVKTAMFVLSEVKLGVIPATISPHVIGKIGGSNSKRLFCTAENCNMSKATQMGLVQQVVDSSSQFGDAVQNVCKRLQACAPGAVASAKPVLLNYMNAPASESLLVNSAEEYVRVRKGEEAENAMKSLQMKKKPSWLEVEIKVPDI
eukprot:gnl/TRDRNA2_/TRDRNA2_173872_c0_seq4.p1 gnl/TRDRNA2_/TRDRNA2_173872_c0~~gnl/TRDRNA2_/TRDRNA2_173872_c0_seq4.p1  ORF type:complete len:397 (-),score=96.27 gnl/TRDRNA2_/TRDRNA2_173872_c0_seq4:79-1269(-)